MPAVTILLATCNGALHLPEQLASFLALEHRDWALWASDDGSTDETPALLRDFQGSTEHEVRLLTGPGRGAAANFLALLADPDLPNGPVALSDQDDVWYPGRIARALALLDAAGSGPRLYCSRTRIGLSREAPLRDSPLHRRPPSLRNALIQSLGGGNTMVLSPEAVVALRAFGTAPDPAYHDWWLYQAISAVGGTVIYDPEPSLFYRQHAANELGTNRGRAARGRRLSMIWDGRYAGWIERNLAGLDAAEAALTDEARQVLDGFRTMRQLRGPAAIRAWQRLGLYRQHRAETALMMAAAAAGRL